MSYKPPVVWKDIPGYQGYQVSNYGDVKKRFKNGKIIILKPFMNKKNKPFVVRLKINGKKLERFIHHLVAKAFLDDPPNRMHVLDHKNGLKYDNYAGNLEYISNYNLGKKHGKRNNQEIPVIKIDAETGEELEYYRSIVDAARDNYIHKTGIGKVILGKQRTAAGFRWKKDFRL